MTEFDSLVQKIEALITSFRNATTNLLHEDNFTEFEQAVEELPNTQPDKIQFYLQAGEALLTKMIYEKAQQYLEQGLSIARKKRRLSEQAVALGTLAELARLQGDYRVAFCHIDDALEVLTQVNDDVVLARLLILAGLNDISLGMYESATARFYKAYGLYGKLKDDTGVALAMIRLGTANMMQKEYGEAEKWLTKSLVLCDMVGDKHLKAGALTNLGEIYRLRGNHDSAYEHYRQANTLFGELALWRGVAITTNNMAHLAVQKREYGLAEELYTQAFQTIVDYGLVPEMLDTLAGMCLLLTGCGNIDVAKQIAQKLINSPILLDESKLLLGPVVEQFDLEPGKPEIIDTSRLKGLFDQAIQALPKNKINSAQSNHQTKQASVTRMRLAQ